LVVEFQRNVAVIGGCGHVGLPLAIVLADRGHQVVSYDLNRVVVDQVNQGRMPFDEPGAPKLLARVIKDGTFEASADPCVISTAENIVVVIGTPVDEHLNPDPEAVPRAVAQIIPHLRDGQHLVLRSTVYPGVTKLVEKVIADSGLRIDVSFCPERIAEGKALEELIVLPQIVSSRTEAGRLRAERLFGSLAEKIIIVEPEEAELAKLFTNTWRYIKFAAANQFYTIANDYGLDFERIRHAITSDYPRAADMPGAGFAAGPCLFKDTMQLAAFNNNNFTLGHASMMINEGLPLYVVSRLERKFDLSTTRVGILGMAFKGESDDTRSSLAYKLRRILNFKAENVLCADPYVASDPRLVTEDEVVGSSDVIIIGAPHKRYATLTISQPVIDIWNIRSQGVLI
jgi:UDP-N-acetyl-D-mannosaminuronic acid dehydrogenase